jgi:hypothetical protein
MEYSREFNGFVKIPLTGPINKTIKNPEQDHCCRAEAPATMEEDCYFSTSYFTGLKSVAYWTEVQL